MGDNGESAGMKSIERLIQENTPEEVYIVRLVTGEGRLGDVLSGFFKPVNEQVEEVCELLASDENFADGYHSVGLSQVNLTLVEKGKSATIFPLSKGGQFLRAVAQRCPSPPMRSLISLGGQHQGIFGFPNCPGETFDLCNGVREILTLGAYAPAVQNNLVQAQVSHEQETVLKKSISAVLARPFGL